MYEILLVNDASPDDSWSEINQLAQDSKFIKGISLSRNFGQHHAITAGLDFSQGDWVVVMDCDLQDVPEEIAKLYATAMSGYDVVVGRRANRQDGFLKKFFSRMFYSVFFFLTGSKVDNRIGNYGIYSRQVIDNIRQLREQNRSFGLFAIWVGFKRLEIDVTHDSRKLGRSSYNFSRMARLAFDSLIAHSNRLLYMAIGLGLCMATLSLAYAAWLTFSHVFWAAPVIGWTSLIVSIFFTSGLIIGTIGIVGLYVGKIFEEVKGRPLYIVRETTFEMDAHD